MTAASRTNRSPGFLIALSLALAACSENDDGDGQGEGGDENPADDGDDGSSSAGSDADTGTIRVTFTVGGSVAESPNLVDPLMGWAYGGVFRSADVGATGPRDGAEQVTYFEAEGIDLTTTEVSTASWTSDPLPPDTYTFLGYFDVDGSSATSEEKDPEEGDPVTLPSANTVTLEAGATAELVIRFDLVL